MKWLLCLAAIFVLSGCAKGSQNALNKSIYPLAKQGQKQVFVSLEPIKDESKYIVSFSFGKELSLDCNHYFLASASLKRHSLAGWGYDYYELDAKGDLLAGTKMACPNQPYSQKFVRYNIADLILRYNSKLPFVFYVPNDVSVKFEIYKKVKEGILDK